MVVSKNIFSLPVTAKVKTNKLSRFISFAFPKELRTQKSQKSILQMRAKSVSAVQTKVQTISFPEAAILLVSTKDRWIRVTQALGKRLANFWSLIEGYSIRR